MGAGKQKLSGREVVERDARRVKLLNHIAMGVTLLFCASLGVAVWYTEGRVLAPAIDFLAKFESEGQASRNSAQNCMHPKNKNTPYCQERAAQLSSEWQAMSRAHGGKVNQFTLHQQHR